MAGVAPPPLLLLLRIFLSACCVLLLMAVRPSLAVGPCQRSTSNNRWIQFKEEHLVPGTPDTLDQNAWFRFIKAHTPLCDRPTQSFLYPAEEAWVKAVCSSKGGRVYKDNLCISLQQFQYVTVRSKLGTCEIESVTERTKSLILACDNVNNLCLPVHFEGNPNNDRPDPKARACERAPNMYNADADDADADADADANDAGMPTWLWVLTSAVGLVGIRFYRNR